MTAVSSIGVTDLRLEPNSRPTPKQEKLYTNALSVDPEVQRTVDQNWVKREVERFNPMALGVVVVSARTDGSYKVIDGQHRVELCRRFGYKMPLSALVYRELTLPEEAAMFRVLNNRRKVHPIDLFKVRVVEGEEVAVKLNTLLNNYGWKVAASKSVGTFSSITTLEKVYLGYGAKPGANLGVCESVISVITQAWDHNAHGARGEIITGLGLLFTRYRNGLNIAKLVTEMKGTPGGPLVLCGRAKMLRDVSNGRIGDAMATNFINMLNKGTRTNKLPDWMSE